MAYLEKDLLVKRSTLPDSGKGLFTRVFIPKGTRILEYKGKITTWAKANHDDGNNGYIFFVSRNHVIDAHKFKTGMAQYANDAAGLKRVTGIKNNAEYSIEKKKVYVDAVKDIPAGSEIFIAYGKEYWDVIKKNGVLD